MFAFDSDKAPPSKCYVTCGMLKSDHIDPKQPPSKKKPYSTMLNQSFTHTVLLAIYASRRRLELMVGIQIDLILPEELYEVIWKKIESKISNVQYARVIMPLSALLEDDFFNHYIKSGTTHWKFSLLICHLSTIYLNLFGFNRFLSHQSLIYARSHIDAI